MKHSLKNIYQENLRRIYLSHLVEERTPDLFVFKNQTEQILPKPKQKRYGMIAGTKVQDGIKEGKQLSEEKHFAWEKFLSVWEETPEKVYVWSDHHLYHRNISKYSGRPFDNIDIMNQTMLDNAVNTLNNDDYIIFGGDLTFGNSTDTKAWLKQIPGKKYLIIGNHDIDRKDKIQWIQKLGFEGIIDCLALSYKNQKGKNQKIWLTHYPLPDKYLSDDTINVYGHVHQKLLEGRHVNMCVEHTNYSPVKLKDMV